MTFLLIVSVASLLGTVARAAADDQMDKLQERFKQRYEQILQLKTAGKVGETFEGFIDWVKAEDASAAKLVNDENADRRELYALIAAKEKTTPGLVGERNARRNFEKAQKGEYLRGKDGKWTQKA